MIVKTVSTWALAIVASATALQLRSGAFSAVLMVAICVAGHLFSKHSRRKIIKLGLLFAASVIAVRMGFRIVFSVSSSSPVLLDLPRIPVDTGISKLTILGPISTDTLLSGFSAGSSLAVTVLSFAVASAISPPKTLLAAMPNRFQPVILPIYVALALIPELIESLSTQRLNRKIRKPTAENKWLARLSPAIERAISRSSAITENLILHSGSNIGVFEVCAPAIRLPMPGELVWVSGDNGAGKSTHLRILARWATQEKKLRVFMLSQKHFALFLTLSVIDELQLAGRRAGLDKAATDCIIGKITKDLAIEHLLTRDVDELSGGERKLVALAAGLMSQPELLILDEPLSQLDSENSERLIKLILKLKSSKSAAIVVAEHRDLEDLSEVAIRVSRRDGNPTPTANNESVDHDKFSSETTSQPCTLKLKDVRIEVKQKVRLESFSAEVPAGTIFLLNQPNGFGKTSLLQAIAGATGYQGLVTLNGFDIEAEQVRLVPQDLDGFFWNETIEKELAEAGLSPADAEKFYKFDPGLSPFDLSGGEQRLLAFLIQSSREPELLLLDEPTADIANSRKPVLAEAIKERSRRGMSTLIASHDREFIDLFEFSDRENSRA